MTGVFIPNASYTTRCTISVYYWQVVVYLAWMSSGTHLITLSVLREYLQEKGILRVSRIAGMLIFFFTLFIAIAPTGSQTHYNIISDHHLVISTGSDTDRTDDCIACGGLPACVWNQRY